MGLLAAFDQPADIGFGEVLSRELRPLPVATPSKTWAGVPI
jgi:hypothetical protein